MVEQDESWCSHKLLEVFLVRFGVQVLVQLQDDESFKDGFYDDMWSKDHQFKVLFLHHSRVAHIKGPIAQEVMYCKLK